MWRGKEEIVRKASIYIPARLRTDHITCFCEFHFSPATAVTSSHKCHFMSQYRHIHFSFDNNKLGAQTTRRLGSLK